MEITGFTADRMLEIENGTVVSAEVNGDGDLILTKKDLSTVNAGHVIGPMGPGGPGGGIPKATVFPSSPADGDILIRTDQAFDPLWKFSDGAWQRISGVGKGAQIYATTQQTISGGFFTPLSMVGVNFDDFGMFNSGAPTRLTVPTGMDGRWLFSANCDWEPSSSDKKAIGFRRDGGSYRYFQSTPAGGSWPGSMKDAMSTAGVFNLIAGAYIELIAVTASTQLTDISNLEGVMLTASYLGQ